MILGLCDSFGRICQLVPRPPTRVWKWSAFEKLDAFLDRRVIKFEPWNLLSGFRLKHRRDMSVTVLFRQVLVIEFSLILWNAGRGTDLCPCRVSIAIEIFDA